jgi:hypothetical protein
MPKIINRKLSNNKANPTSIRIHRYVEVITAVNIDECK